MSNFEDRIKEAREWLRPTPTLKTLATGVDALIEAVGALRQEDTPAVSALRRVEIDDGDALIVGLKERLSPEDEEALKDRFENVLRAIGVTGVHVEIIDHDIKLSTLSARRHDPE